MRKEELGLEEALEELEGIVLELEDGKISLEKSLALYEKGIGLVRICNHRLDNVEKRIESLAGEVPPDLL